MGNKARPCFAWAGLLLAGLMLSIQIAPAVGWAAPARRKADEAKLKEAEDLKGRYEKLLEEGKYRESIALAEKTCAILENALGRRSEKLAECLNTLGELYYYQGEYGKAEPLYKRALAIRERALSPHHPDVAESLNNLGVLYSEQGEYGKATLLHERALAMTEKALGSDHPDVAIRYNNLAALFGKQGEYGKAVPLFERALAICEKALGPDHPHVAVTLTNLAFLFGKQGKYGKAEPLYQRALAIREKALGPDHPDVAYSLNNLAMLYDNQGEYGKALPLYELAMARLEGALGHDHPDVAQCLCNLAALYRAQGKFEKALPLYERALAIREKTLGSNHPNVAQSLNNLATLYEDQGEYGKALPLYERALVVCEKALGHDHPDTAISLNNLASLYRVQGKYEKAEPLYERAMTILEKALGLDHPHVAKSLNNLAGLYEDQGEYGKAVPLYKRAMTIFEKALGPDHPDVAMSLNNLASSYARQGEYEKAELLYERALAIFENVLGPEHPHVALSLNNLAMLYEEQGEHGKAEPLYERSLAIYEEALGPDHPLVALNLNNLAGLYEDQGEYRKAEPLYKRALTIREKALGPDHLEVAQSLDNFAWLHVELGRDDSAVVFRRRALDIEYEYIGRTLLFAEEHRRLDFAGTISGTFDATLSAHLQAAPDHHPSAELALTTLLRRKGLLLDLGARSAATIRRTLPEEHHHLLDELSVTRDRYAALSKEGPGPRTVERFSEQLAEIQQEQHHLWREIADHSPIVETLSKPVAIADIQRTLSPNGVLVEYIRYFPTYHEKAPGTPAVPRYAAYLVFPDHFTWVDLGVAETIENEVTTFRRGLVGKFAVSSPLHDLVMAPVRERLGEADTLFLAPDAALNLIPFAALHDGERYLVERYPLHTLTTGRDLLHPWDTGATAGQAVVVVANPTGAKLPGTEREAELLGELFPHAETLLHDAATEAGAQRHTQPWLMHLATHGFFEVPERDPKLEAAMAEYQQSMSPSAMQFAPGRIDNPMQHAGLLLAPAAPTTDDETETQADDAPIADGRLTAYEISGWDLRGTELVVLSACGTGLGKVEAGEGVFGLRRAFAMAGVQTQVMSLWSVADGTTATLMDAYYRKLLDGKGRGEAMREVQLEMLRSTDHRHPGDWASFVVVGDWGPLSAERLPKIEEPPAVENGCGCQRASIGGDEQPGAVLLLGLLGLLAGRRRRRRSPSRAYPRLGPV
jgi:tetratricopeptide (TPR) repeat protein/CHAT domain-containing protein